MTADLSEQPVPERGRNTAMIVITILPFAGLIAAVTLLWNKAVGPSDLALFAGMYVLCGFGITIGFHSPHHGYSSSIWGRLQGLAHAHVGWMFGHNRTERERYAKDLLGDRLVVAISKLFPLWVVLSFAIPFALGGLITGSWKGAFTGLVWGGLVRLFFNHHITWSVNSICHVFGRRPFAAADQSTNNWVLALPSLGEAWHHNHHVFPTSAFHGLGWRQIDLSGLTIAVWEKLHLVRNVRRPTAEQIGRKRAAAAGV
jgi:stearoyl-CoA desaturase (Delta-9 desaturase)